MVAPMQPMAQPAPFPGAAEEGGAGLGFLAGFFGGVVGLVLVLVLAKGPKTKKGAIIGIVCQVVLAFLLGLLGALSLFMFRPNAHPTVSPPAVSVPASR